jgi:regulator of protease activity HflC (stomatin/prohibitin superfamily)
MNPFPTKLVVLVALLAIFVIASFSLIGRQNVSGSEVCVWQNWGGVQTDVSHSGTYFYLRPYSTPTVYSIAADTFIVDDHIDKANNAYMTDDEREHDQCDMPPITIPVQMEYLSQADKANGKTTGPTPVLLRCIVQFHLDPTLIVKLHKEKTNSFRTIFMKGIVIDSLITHTTSLDARTVYLGDGRIALEKAINDDLRSNQSFKDYGVVIEKFILKQADLTDTAFLEKMTAESRAEQTRRTAEKQKLASLAEADAAKAAAQAEQNTRLVEAETKKQEFIATAEADKQQKILAAEAAAQQVVLAANADAEKVRAAAGAEKDRMALSGEGERLQKIAQADGVLALGKAEAAAKKLLLETYEGVGGQRATSIEIAKSLGAGIQKIYYIPEHMGITSVAKDFQTAIQVGLPSQDETDKK